MGTFIIFTKINQLRILSRGTLRAFWIKHNDCEQQLKSWFQEAYKASWNSLTQVRKDFPTASVIAGNRMVFNIKGNHYRLVVKINYEHPIVWIRFIGSHSEYDKIDVTKI